MKIGLTGSIATGKSTVAQMLSEQGFPVIDADLIARQVVAPGSDVLQKIAELFGKEILAEDGSLNREKLGALIFEDPQKRESLNRIIHPAIRREMNEQAAQAEKDGHPVVILDIPLLFENNLMHTVDKTLVVYLPEKVQQQRLKERNGYSDEEAAQRIASQQSIELKKEKADYVVDNSATLEETKKQVEIFIESLPKSP